MLARGRCLLSCLASSPSTNDRSSTNVAASSSVDGCKLEEAAAHIARANRVVAFTGAGASSESGISTYRDTTDAREGLWDGIVGTAGLLIFGTSFGFRFLPDAAWRHYCERLLQPISRAQPNPAHTALAHLAGVTITQNVDGMHQRAGSNNVIELHGSVARHRHAWTGKAISVNTAALDPLSPPARFVRPDVVLFFEGMPAAFWEAADLVASLGPGDVLLVVGTSCAVAPANRLPYSALSRGCRVVEINVERALGDELPITPTNDDVIAKPLVEFGHVVDIAELQTYVRGPAGRVLPALLERARQLRLHNSGANSS